MTHPRAPRIVCLTIAMAAVVPARQATAGTTLTRVPLVCPVCDLAFESVAVQSTNRGEGVCRDLFARAIGSQPIFYMVHTCPRCYYSGYFDDFQNRDRVDKSLRQRILDHKILRPATPIPRSSESRNIPVTTRYGLAVQVYSLRRAPAEPLAWLYLRWAWCVRDEGTFLPPTPLLMEVMREVEPRLPEPHAVENQADRELQAVNLLTADWFENRFAPQREPCVRLVLAMLLRRHGENRQALPLLRELIEQEALEDPLAAAAGKMLASIDEERRLLAEARMQFERAVDRGEIKSPNLAPAQYLLGELCRRLDDDSAARLWYDRALANPDLDRTLHDWAVQQREFATPQIIRSNRP